MNNKEIELEQELSTLKTELERVQKQAAAMRVAIIQSTVAPNSETARVLRDEALNSDAGRDYIHREQIKPLIQATEELLQSTGGSTKSESAEFHGHDDDLVLVQKVDFERLEEELNHTRNLI